MDRIRILLFLIITPVVAAMFLITMAMGCAGARPKDVTCNSVPEYWIHDEKGVATHEIYVCFGKNGQLVWNKKRVPQKPNVVKKATQ